MGFSCRLKLAFKMPVNLFLFMFFQRSVRLCFSLLVLTCGHVGAGASGAPAPHVFIDNGEVRLGVDLDSGGGIFYFSKIAPERNLLNYFDKGRLIQQSYYGRLDGSFWNKKPWRWNPVQGGNWEGKPSTVLAYSLQPEKLYVKTMPKSWSGGDVHDAVMEEWIGLQGQIAHIHFKFTYSGDLDNPIADQEVPAIFMDYALDNLVFYSGPAPWMNGALSWRSPGPKNESAQADENWAAFVDDKGWGLGAYFPQSTRLTTYRVPANGQMGPNGAACSYFAPIQRLAITRGWTHEYDVYLVIGGVSDIRAAFAKIHKGISP